MKRMNQVIEAIRNRRSIRQYTERQISREDLEQIVEAGLYAPTAMNRQTWHFTVVHSRDKIARLAKAMGKVLGNPGYNFYLPDALIMVSNHKDGCPKDCACGLENIFLAAYSLGIGSCWIDQVKDTEKDPEVKAILTEFGVPEDHVVVGTAALGYAVKEAAAPARAEGTVSWVE